MNNSTPSNTFHAFFLSLSLMTSQKAEEDEDEEAALGILEWDNYSAAIQLQWLMKALS